MSYRNKSQGKIVSSKYLTGLEYIFFYQNVCIDMLKELQLTKF